MKKKESKGFNLEGLSIKRMLNLSYRLLMVFTLIVAVVAIFAIRSLNNSLGEYINGADQADNAIKTLGININTAARNVREMALTTDTSTYPEYYASIESTLSGLQEQLDLIKTSGALSEAEYQEYIDTVTTWANDAYTIVGDIQNGQRDEAISLIFTTCAPELETLITISTELNSTLDAMVDDALSQSHTIFYTGTALVIVFTVVAVFFSMIVRRKIVNAITIPLEEIEMGTEELSKGNLHVEIAYHSNNEFGKLADSLRSSIETLSTYVDDIGTHMHNFAEGDFNVNPVSEWKGDFVDILDSFKMFEKTMTDTLNGIKKVTKVVEGDAKQVSATSMDLAQGATEQASVMEEFTATVETVYEQVSSNAEYAGNISKEVEAVGEEISSTNDKMQMMVRSMSEINESSQKIRKIIDTINDVADQTNLLALNASIEAARAGEAGRGFAVVANQVTSLAAQTADAVKETTTLIETTISEVENGMNITDEIAKQQGKVAVDALNIVDEVNNVAETLKAQDESFNQLNIGIAQINDVIQTNSATSQECAASSQEMSCQADTLSSLVAKFRVKEEQAS